MQLAYQINSHNGKIHNGHFQQMIVRLSDIHFPTLVYANINRLLQATPAWDHRLVVDRYGFLSSLWILSKYWSSKIMAMVTVIINSYVSPFLLLPYSCLIKSLYQLYCWFGIILFHAPMTLWPLQYSSSFLLNANCWEHVCTPNISSISCNLCHENFLFYCHVRYYSMNAEQYWYL